MLYLNTKQLTAIKPDWHQLVELIYKTITIMGDGEFDQPIKPYLRFGDKTNRIIAMPAFVGGSINMSGIKWIASFPKNLNKGMSRAQSVTILNDVETGQPKCIVNTALISEIRTAAVSGLILKKYLEEKSEKKKFSIGIIGFGQIGKAHLAMINQIMQDRILEIKLYDLKEIPWTVALSSMNNTVKICDSFDKLYENSDIIITTTVSEKRYISKKPKKGSLHLNVSLRDYLPSFKNFVDKMIVDNWEEVCRENTDIEQMYLNEGLIKEKTFNLVDIFYKNLMPSIAEDDVIMFNPMGMAVFDIAVGTYYYLTALEKNIGNLLDD
ncbi:2,3-diaminopropionate biosynthesis protein SbnB [Flavobacterium sp. ZT3R18]|uniref:2,3-diaminopropionate biosynthesis protein SbnB n=1 Tax=Flavobacterium sp. ZT3R18 TaxID=2594429 RepID=UPI00117AE8C3|nr:2,3-diaminopropionate biosynthesis protein SbnB [Flavobacterium sp. ZT3R18]TRX32538.1 2,3-diaminopropionate biosynthesis protein SbnB [Flavobacterium sp. ZT3R18]